MPTLNFLHCETTYDDFFVHDVNGIVPLLLSWEVTEKDLYQGLYAEADLIVDIGWHSAEPPSSEASYFRISVVRASHLGWDQLVVSWVVRDFERLRDALTLVDAWCLSRGSKQCESAMSLPRIRNDVERDNLSSLDVGRALEELEGAGLLGKAMYVARYGTTLTLQVDWQVLNDLEGVEGEPYAFRGFKLRLTDSRTPALPIVDWATETLAELFLAMRSIDQWYYAATSA